MKKVFEEVDYKVVDELKFRKGRKKPGTHLRLVESEKKNLYIQLWSNLSKQWVMMYRFNVENEWRQWRQLHARIYNKK